MGKRHLCISNYENIYLLHYFITGEIDFNSQIARKLIDEMR